MEDIEMELDLGEPIAQQPDEHNFNAPSMHPDSTAHTPSAPVPALLDAEPVPNKLHVRGLDELATADIRAFAEAHFGDEVPKVEWIDDTSANLVYTSSDLASSALAALALPAETPTVSVLDPSSLHPLQLRTARPAPTHPAAALAVRGAVATDRKKARAADESRFYLLHPEHDPRERQPSRRNSNEHVRRRRFDGREHARRRRSDRRQGYDESMYGDDANGEGERRGSQSSMSTSSRDETRRRRRDRDRDRGSSRASRNRDRSRSPRNRGKELLPAGPRHAVVNAGKELFADKSKPGDGGSILRHDDALPVPDDLFPQRDDALRASGPRDLFADRTDATASLFSRIAVPLLDGADDVRPGLSIKGAGTGGGSLASRVTSSGSGRRGSDSQDQGLNIAGRAGLSIKGAAAAGGDRAGSRDGGSGARTEAKLRELFPEKRSANVNAGKELFGGARGARKRAEGFFG